jgi:FAD/FMN-containing dehydrogenase
LPLVGVVSYTLGGGLGPLARAYGFAADHVWSFDLVPADAELRHASADEHPDLFWGVRGGKGNVGIVTAMEFDLVPVSRLCGGGLYFDCALAADVLHAYRGRMEPWGTGRRYINFLAAETPPGFVRDAYTPEAYERLVALTSTYDPGNVFQINHNIAPRTSNGAAAANGCRDE